ncbi:MAG: O-methyltransferase [Planctomycetota bacterium]
MPDPHWSNVDAFFEQHLLHATPELQSLRDHNAAAGLPQIDVSPLQAKLLHLLARLRGAKRILEIGTLGGYSTVWLAKALPAPPEGHLTTLELNPKHADTARQNFAANGVADRITLRLGPALDSLHDLLNECPEPYDFVFIDADKANIPAYFEHAKALASPNAAIVIDNTIRGGKVAEPDPNDPTITGIRTLVEQLNADPDVSATAIQTVGSKGYDGFILALMHKHTL